MLRKIISGGQTGVDRAALDAAMELGFETGGKCPRGRIAEDGQIPDEYMLTETGSPEYPVRTEKNVVESDGTLIISNGPVTGGTALTSNLAARHGKSVFTVDFLGNSIENAVPEAAEWIRHNRIRTLNVAGPRESTNPGIHSKAYCFVKDLLLNLSGELASQ